MKSTTQAFLVYVVVLVATFPFKAQGLDCSSYNSDESKCNSGGCTSSGKCTWDGSGRGKCTAVPNDTECGEIGITAVGITDVGITEVGITGVGITEVDISGPEEGMDMGSGMDMTMFDTKEEAEAAAAEMGCSGAHKMGDQWMPGKQHNDCQPPDMSEETNPDLSTAVAGCPEIDDYMTLLQTECGSEPLSCSYGEECCCDECHPTFRLECMDGRWEGMNTEACMLPEEDICPEKVEGMDVPMFDTKEEAEAAAAEMGCSGAHKMGVQWMPGKQHNDCQSPDMSDEASVGRAVTRGETGN